MPSVDPPSVLYAHYGFRSGPRRFGTRPFNFMLGNNEIRKILMELNIISKVIAAICCLLIATTCKYNNNHTKNVETEIDISPGWFVVAEKDVYHGDSYLIYLEKRSDIDTANAIIHDPKNTTIPKIVVAEIENGGDGINGNVTGDGKLWNWRVKRFDGFAENTIEILDGWPTYLESDVDGWISITNGFIGFWGYTIRSRYTLKANN